jgi:MFS family permease
MREDIDLSGNRYSMAAAIFFLGFIAGVYPASRLAQKYPVENVAGGLVLLWGVCFILTAACTTYQGLYTQRFFLGALEAGVSPIFMLIVGQFYRKDEQALMMGWVSCCEQCH